MTLRHIAVRAEKLVTDNSPAILTAVGVVGTVSTAYLTGRASFKAAQVLENARETRELLTGEAESPMPFTKNEKLKMLWKLYIPAVSAGAFTVTSIVLANRIGTRRAAVLAAAYSISEQAFSEYKDKVKELVGKGKEQKVRDEIAQDHVNAVSGQHVIMTNGGESLFMDDYSGRQFMSSMEAVKAAENNVNYRLIHDGYASLTDFYNELGLPATKMSDDMGWNSNRLLEVKFSTTISDEKKPCMVVDFVVAPVRHYFRTHG